MQPEVISQTQTGSIIAYAESREDRSQRLEREASVAYSELRLTPGQQETLFGRRLRWRRHVAPV